MAASEWEQAGAVVDRIWDTDPQAVIASQRDRDGVEVWIVTIEDEDAVLYEGHGPTYVAALIDLGRRWDAARTREDAPHREDDAE